jgi:hypothetical protein
LNIELAVTGIHSKGLTDVADIFGYLIVCFAEPMAVLSYAARYLRVKRIFDA